MDEIIKYGGYIGMVIVGALMYFFPARKKELDEATKTLIDTLMKNDEAREETINILTRDLNIYKEKTVALESHQKENIAKIAAIDAERILLEKFINGRDKKTEEFQTLTIALHKSNSDKITELVNLLGKHFVNMETMALNSGPKQ